jgi:putative intracellular protease/amidase
MRQYLGSPVLQQQVARFWSLGRPVAAICHGVLVLARTRDPATGRSVLAGRQTTCLPKYMERSAWLATAWRLGRYYRTYPAYVQDEVEAALDDPHRQFRRGPRTLSARGTATDDTAAFVVADRNYLSARWPGDAYLFGRRFCDLLQAAGSPEASSPDTSNPDTSAQWITAAELASRAAAAAMASPDVTPGQWVYRRNAVVAVPEQADRPVIVERWATADGTAGAAYVDGRLEVGPWAWPVGPGGQSVRSELGEPHISYASLASLPDDPGALVDLLASTPVPRDDAAYNPGHAFEMIAGLFQRFLMPPGPAARVFRALGAIPGVTAEGDDADAAGNRGAGFLLAGAAGGNQEILVSPETYRFRGYQFLGEGRDIRSGSGWGIAVLRQDLVSGPGVRPAGL